MALETSLKKESNFSSLTLTELNTRKPDASERDTYFMKSLNQKLFSRFYKRAHPPTSTTTSSSHEILLKTKLANLPTSLLRHLAIPPHEILQDIIDFTHPGHSIDDIAQHLISKKIVITSPRDAQEEGEEDDDDDEVIYHARTITFLLLGYQTMLYPPTINTTPNTHLALDDILDGFLCTAYMTLKQEITGRIRLPISEFLLGYGLMLPRENICLSDEQEDNEAFEKQKVIRPEEINAAVLCNVGKVNIEWIDVLGPHLEFDKDTRTLYLFRHPEFIVEMLRSNGTGLLYSCCSTSSESSESQWATSPTTITQYLTEILLSYRLLFAQTSSRHIFQKTLNPNLNQPPRIHHQQQQYSNSPSPSPSPSPLLSDLCTSPTSPLPSLSLSLPADISLPEDKPHYRPQKHFPILRSRLLALTIHLEASKPTSLIDLWRDKRDSAAWMTFWAVLIIGGCGVLLAFVQVVLQALQLGGVGG